MYPESPSSDPHIVDQLRQEKFREQQLTELQVGIVLGKLEGRGYDMPNARLIHKRKAKLPNIAQQDFLKSSFEYKFLHVQKLPSKDFEFLSDCMDWKALWERVNYLYGCECIELPIKGADDQPYYGFFVGKKTTAPVGLTAEDIHDMDLRNGWKTKEELAKIMEKEESIELTVQLSGWKLENVLKFKEYKGFKTIFEAYEGYLRSRKSDRDWQEKLRNGDA